MMTTVNNTSPAPTAKIHTIMEAASALTALGDEDSASNNNEDLAASTAEDTASAKNDESTSTNKKKQSKRYLPNHKKPDAALTFPEKMMKMMQYSETQGSAGDADFCVAWLEDGKSFVIRNCDEFTRSIVPLFFKATKFASFTRKLYRWGFRQVNRGIGPDDPIIFGNEHFLRDHPEDMTNMKSVTAASARKAETGNGDESSNLCPTMMLHPQLIFGINSTINSTMKRSFEQVVSEHDNDSHNNNNNKRALFDDMFGQQGHKVSATMGGGNSSQYQQQQMQMQPTSLYGVAAQSMPHTMNGQYQQNYQQQQQQELHYQPIKAAAPYEMMMNHHNNNNNQGNSLLNQFAPHHHHHQGNHHHHHNNNNMNSSSQYPSVNSTAEIVNAAIAALRYA